MKLLVLTVFVYAAAVSAQLIISPGGLSQTGSDIGSRVGSGIGGGLGRVMDQQLRPSLVGRNTNEGGRFGSRDREGGASYLGGQGYANQDYGSAFERGGSYTREKMVNEREFATDFLADRNRQSSSRGGSGGQFDVYGRDRETYGDGFNQGYMQK